MKSRKPMGHGRVEVIIGFLSFLMPWVFLAKTQKQIDGDLKSRSQNITKNTNRI